MVVRHLDTELLWLSTHMEQ